MLAARIQRRAFSASARQVRTPPPSEPRNGPAGELNLWTAADFALTLQLSKVTVLGAAGGIGQPLSLLLKLNPRVTELALYDIRGGPGEFG